MATEKDTYDVIVAGAGIPGLYAARELRKSGRTVLLLESSATPELSNYSTAGIPYEVLKEFGLPAEAVNASIFHVLVGTGQAETRKSLKTEQPLAFVLDFSKTKRLMTDELRELGVDVRYGEKALGIEHSKNSDALQTVRTSYGSSQALDVLDATGSAGTLAVQLGLRDRVPDALTVGMEYRIQTEERALKRFTDSIGIYFDVHLLPHGYGWIFADGKNIFKVGLIEYWCDKKRGLPPLEQRLRNFLNWLGVDILDRRYQVLEKHGGSKFISNRFNQIRLNRTYAIGDSMGAINPFLAEGIRQGLVSAQLAVQAITRGKPSEYEKEWNRFKGLRWKLCHLWASLCYAHPSAFFIEKIVKVADKMTAEELARLVFEYEFELIVKRAPWSTAQALYSKRLELLNQLF